MVHHIVYHILFYPKRRKKVLVGPVHDRLQESIRQVAADQDWKIIELAIHPDHVHLLLQTNPLYAAYGYCQAYQGTFLSPRAGRIPPPVETSLVVDAFCFLYYRRVCNSGHHPALH
jgi:hypothetical protein